MIRALIAAALLAPLFPLAACADSTMLQGKMPSLSQGRPAVAQRAYTPAPVPDPDLLAPRSPSDPNAVRVAPSLLRTNTGRALAGDGFASGSAYNGDLERRSGSSGLGTTMAPGVNFKMPVQVELR